MAKDKDGKKQLPKGVTWVEKKQLYMGRFAYQGVSYTMYDKTLKGINKKLTDKRYEAEHGVNGKADKIKLDEWFEIWLNDYKINKIKPTTRQSYESLYKCQIKDALGNYYLTRIKPIDIQKMYNRLIEKGLSTKYLHSINAVLYNIFDLAVKNDMLLKNPCNAVVKPPIHTKERRVLSVKEQERFLKFIRRDAWRLYEPTMTVLLGTGLRIGELQALKWEDIDFDNKTISVSKTLVYVKDKDTGRFRFEFQSPKTRNGNRTIPMGRSIEKALKRQKANQDCLRLQKGWHPRDGFENLVFSGNAGQPQQRSVVQFMLDKIVKAINAEEEESAREENRMPDYMEHLHPHALRHTFATRCFEVDMPPKTVQMLLGHSSIQMTLDLYTHVSEKKKQQDMKKLDEIFADIV